LEEINKFKRTSFKFYKNIKVDYIVVQKQGIHRLAYDTKTASKILNLYVKKGSWSGNAIRLEFDST